MWQVVLAAAAAAGSSILAKKLIHNNEAEKPISDSGQSFHESEIQPLQPQDSVSEENSGEDKKDENNEDGKIFRFSSAQKGDRDLKKKPWSGGFKGLKKNGAKKGKKSAGEKHSDCGKRVTVCLKKRRTGRVASGKCESCSSKDNSFGWGVGLGIMYMMSAGKAEISRLNLAMEETGKVVQELKAEISRRKSLHNAHTECEAERNTKHFEGSYGVFTKLGGKSKNKIPTFGPSIEEGECGSSGVTEEQQLELQEMDRLEAELESELQKLPRCTADGFSTEGREVEGLARKCQPDEDYMDSDFPQSNGVLPTELDNKLCHVLIEQQEGQIAELEAELHQANSKLDEKEAELEALKNCVKRLNEFSLASVSSDDENDVKTRDRVEPTKSSTVGMKRSLGMK